MRCTDEGWEHEADTKHAEKLVSLMKLDEDQSKGVDTPGDKNVDQFDGAEELLNQEEYELFRTGAGITQYLALDGYGINFATKELVRRTSAPTKGCMAKLKRLARYLRKNPRLIMRYKWQRKIQHLTACMDADHAGCSRTRKSTTGGAIMRGDHTLMTISSTDPTTALSSAESGLYAIVRGVVELLYSVQLLPFFKDEVKGIVMSDSSAGRANCMQLGTGKRMRHVETQYLFIQKIFMEKTMGLGVIKGTENPGDMGTKYQKKEMRDKVMKLLGYIVFATQVKGARGSGITDALVSADTSLGLIQKVVTMCLSFGKYFWTWGHLRCSRDSYRCRDCAFVGGS